MPGRVHVDRRRRRVGDDAVTPIGWSTRMRSERGRSGTLWRALVGVVAATLALTGCGGRSPTRHVREVSPSTQTRRPIMSDVGMGGEQPGPQGSETEQPGDEGGGENEPGPTGPPAAVIPDVRGLVFERAVEALWRSGIDFGLVFARESPGTLWEVVEEDPPPGTATPASAEVNLVLALPHMHHAGVNGTVRCVPERDELDDTYCLGKLLRY